MHGEFGPAFRGFYQSQAEIIDIFYGSVNEYNNIPVSDVGCILYAELVVAFQAYMVKTLFTEPGLKFLNQAVTQAVILAARVPECINKYPFLMGQDYLRL
jgi:hypothetical protein